MTNNSTARDDSGMGGWLPIETLPPEGTAVLVYFAREDWADPQGNPVSLGPLRDHVERCEIGWFEHGLWWESGTGHDMFEDWRGPEGWPTHWMPLPSPPLPLDPSLSDKDEGGAS